MRIAISVIAATLLLGACHEETDQHTTYQQPTTPAPVEPATAPGAVAAPPSADDRRAAAGAVLDLLAKHILAGQLDYHFNASGEGVCLGTAGLAFIGTFTRMREQHASNLIGQHLTAGNADVAQRLQLYASALGRAGTPNVPGGTALLDRIVRGMATTQGVMDSYVAIAVAVLGALFVLALIDPPPHGPASPLRLLRPRRSNA